MKKAVLLLAVVTLFLTLPAMKASQVITDPSGQFSVGIGLNGELFDWGSNIGIRRNADGFDPLAPGSPYDSYSTYANGSAAAAIESYYGYNIVGSTQTIGTSTASSTTVMGNGITVTQNYSFIGPNVLQIAETVTNTGAASDVLFQRDVDWDVYPTEFNENTFASAIPGGTPVIASTYYGFDQTDPSQPFSAPCTGGCNQTGDLGGGIRLDLGILGTGQSTSFNFFYAISQSGENVNGLDAQLTAAGAQYIVSTQSSEGGAYPGLGADSAAIGYGPSTPEPSSVALFVTAIAGFGAYVRRRRKNA